MQATENINISALTRLGKIKFHGWALFWALAWWVPAILIAMLFESKILAVIFTFLWLVGIGICLAIMIVGVKKYQKHKAALVAQLCQDNGWQFWVKPEIAIENLTGSIYKHGDKKEINYKIASQLDNFSFDIYEYSYVEGSGKSRTNYQLLIMDIPIERQWPHIIIDSFLESGYLGSALPFDIEMMEMQEFKLEGDFYKYFSVFAPKGTQIETLSMITPDVMQSLMNSVAKGDIEIIDQHLLFYWPIVNGRPPFEDLFATVLAFTSQVKKKVSANTVTSQAPVLSPKTESEELSAVGKIVTVIVLITLAAGFILALSTRVGMTIFLLFTILIMAIAILAIIFSQRRKNKLTNQLRERNEWSQKTVKQNKGDSL